MPAITMEVLTELREEAQSRGYGYWGVENMLGCSAQTVDHYWPTKARQGSPVWPISRINQRVQRILGERHARLSREEVQKAATKSSMIIDQSILNRLTEKVTIVGKVKISMDVNGTPAHIIEEDDTYNEGDTVLIKNEEGEHKIVKLQPTIALVPVG